jgi:predicted lipoprotein
MLLTAGLCSCVPWTVRPIDSEQRAVGAAETVALTPAAYVESIWDSKLVPAVLDSAVDARVLLDALAQSPAEAVSRYERREASGPAYFLVTGSGVVVSVDTRSRVGLAMVDVAPFDGRPDVSIQIGPVLRGTALRDATGVVRFSDFVNQLQFADAGNEINERVLRAVLTPLHPASLAGKRVSFAGALPAREASSPALAELVPVRLEVEAQR